MQHPAQRLSLILVRRMTNQQWIKTICAEGSGLSIDRTSGAPGRWSAYQKLPSSWSKAIPFFDSSCFAFSFFISCSTPMPRTTMNESERGPPCHPERADRHRCQPDREMVRVQADLPSLIRYHAVRPSLAGWKMQFDQLKRRELISLLGGAAAALRWEARRRETCHAES